MDGTDLLPAFLAALAVFLALYFRFRTRLPPGPRPWPVVGNLYQIKPVLFRCFAEWAQTYGPIMSVWFGASLTVVVCSSELAREVLKDKDQYLSDRQRTRASTRFSRNGADLIWADYGPHYVKVRKVCNLELFSPKRLEALRPIREDEVTSMVESIFHVCTRGDKTGQTLVLREHLQTVAFNNITRLAFGKRFVKPDGSIDEQGVEFQTIVSNGHKLAVSLSLAEHVPWLRWMFPLEEEAYEKHFARRDNLTKTIMEEHTQARYKSGAKDHFVDALLTLRDQYDLSEDTIIGLLWVSHCAIILILSTLRFDQFCYAARFSRTLPCATPPIQRRAVELAVPSSSPCHLTIADRWTGLDRRATRRHVVWHRIPVG